jgi:nucleolar protein 56
LANKCSIASRIDCFSGKLALPSDPNLSCEHTPPTRLHPLCVDKPSAKFGEALRDQVEERLKLSSKPASRRPRTLKRCERFLRQSALEEEEEEEGSDEEEEGEKIRVDDSPRKDASGFSILPLIEDSPPVEPSPKKKSKKRKGDDMDADRGTKRRSPRKKVKLSKEEKKALKKELKRKRKEEEKAAGVRFFTFCLHLVSCDSDFNVSHLPQESPKKEKKEKKQKKEKKGKSERVLDETTTEKSEKHKKEKKEKKKKNKESRHDLFTLVPFTAVSIFSFAMCFIIPTTVREGVLWF